MKYNREEIVKYIQTLEDYEGYVQLSDRPIEDIWTNPTHISLSIDAKDAFIYEAHFYSQKAKKSIAIRQINSSWLVSETPLDAAQLPESDLQVYHAYEKNVKMAQIWEEEHDALCENMPIKKLKKVVFAGFVGGEK